MCTVSSLKKDQSKSEKTPPAPWRAASAGVVTKPPVPPWPLPREQVSMGASGGPHCLGWGALHNRSLCPQVGSRSGGDMGPAFSKATLGRGVRQNGPGS